MVENTPFLETRIWTHTYLESMRFRSGFKTYPQMCISSNPLMCISLNPQARLVYISEPDTFAAFFAMVMHLHLAKAEITRKHLSFPLGHFFLIAIK